MKADAGRAAKRGRAIFWALAGLTTGCGTSGMPYGVPVDAANRPQATATPPPLLISASEVTGYSSAYLGLVEVTFENPTSVWKQVDHVTVDFGSAAKDQSVTIASADDIDAWARAIAIRNASEPQPILPGTGIEAVGRRDSFVDWIGDSRRPSVAPVEGAPAAAGAAASAAPPPPSYPDQHLLTTPFRVPPGLFTKRWILLSTSDNPAGGCVDSMILGYETSDHATGRVRLPFKVAGTEWQQKACYVPTPPPYHYGH